MPTFEKVAYKGWPNCNKYSSGTVEMIITSDVGPRIMSLSFVGGENMFANFPEADMGTTGGDEWKIYGGHRFWHAPEVQPRTYHPDNDPITVEDKGSHLYIKQPVESTTGIEKELEISFTGDAALKVVHRLTNHNVWAAEMAPWALSVMDVGGTAIAPLPPRGSHAENLLPANSMTFWPYTDMTDQRWTWGEKYVLLRQEPDNDKAQKVGIMVPDGWAAYANKGDLFLKTFDYIAGETYPDLGVNVEIFTFAAMLELETLGPSTNMAPGASVEHTEHWHLFTGIDKPENDADVDAVILPLAKKAIG